MSMKAIKGDLDGVILGGRSSGIHDDEDKGTL